MIEVFLKDIVDNMIETCPKFHFGVGGNIIDTINELFHQNVERFPMIAFIRPFKITPNPDQTHTVNIARVLIATKTDPKIKEETRISLIYDQQLRPIEREFRKTLNSDKRIYKGLAGVNYSIIEQPYFNNEESSDKLDSIIINNLELKIDFKKC